MHPSCLSLDELEADCRWRFARRSGPGGQHRNKVESAAIVEHVPTGMSAEASERRNQADNRRVALQRLRMKLALSMRCPASLDPGQFWQSHLAGGRVRVADDHVDLPAMIAELLDQLQQADWQLELPAAWLGVSNTQVVKLLAKVPAALELVNNRRSESGLRRLRA